MELNHQLLLLEEDPSLGAVAMPQTLTLALQACVVGKAGGVALTHILPQAEA